MWSQREVIDFSLQRRNRLAMLRRPERVLSEDDPCDADPILIKSAKHHGIKQPIPCPVCDKPELNNLYYVFGDQLGQYSGRIKSPDELEQMQDEYGEFLVRVVEVCTACGWNHMILSYLLGDGNVRPTPRRQRTVEDIYG